MFNKILKQCSSDYGELPIRLILAAIFIFHGYGKISGIEGTAGFFASKGLEPSFLLAYMAAYGELIGGALIGLGLFTRLAALNGIVIMIVAIVAVHLGQGFKGMEFQLLILAGFIHFFLSGAGKFSVDHILRSKS